MSYTRTYTSDNATTHGTKWNIQNSYTAYRQWSREGVYSVVSGDTTTPAGSLNTITVRAIFTSAYSTNIKVGCQLKFQTGADEYHTVETFVTNKFSGSAITYVFNFTTGISAYNINQLVTIGFRPATKISSSSDSFYLKIQSGYRTSVVADYNIGANVLTPTYQNQSLMDGATIPVYDKITIDLNNGFTKIPSTSGNIFLRYIYDSTIDDGYSQIKIASYQVDEYGSITFNPQGDAIDATNKRGWDYINNKYEFSFLLSSGIKADASSDIHYLYNLLEEVGPDYTENYVPIQIMTTTIFDDNPTEQIPMPLVINIAHSSDLIQFTYFDFARYAQSGQTVAPSPSGELAYVWFPEIKIHTIYKNDIAYLITQGVSISQPLVRFVSLYQESNSTPFTQIGYTSSIATSGHIYLTNTSVFPSPTTEGSFTVYSSTNNKLSVYYVNSLSQTTNAFNNQYGWSLNCMVEGQYAASQSARSDFSKSFCTLNITNDGGGIGIGQYSTHQNSDARKKIEIDQAWDMILHGTKMSWTYGDTIAFVGGMPIGFGYNSSGAKELIFTINLGKPLHSELVANDLTLSGHLIIRGTSGYVTQATHSAPMNIANYTSDVTILDSHSGLIKIIISRTSAFGNLTNNTPISVASAWDETSTSVFKITIRTKND